MDCKLMHLDEEVASLVIDGRSGRIADVASVRSTELLPVGTALRGDVDVKRFREWWSSRTIPDCRTGLRPLMNRLDIADAAELAVRSMGLSLTDGYWIKPEGSVAAWDSVNFFDNGFSEDVGDLLFGIGIAKDDPDPISPDCTCDGVLKKRWKAIDGDCCLIKSGEEPYMQEPYNEVAAAMIADSMGIDHVEYSLMEHGGAPCSVCRNMIDGADELIPAYRVVRSEIQEPGIRLYDHLVACCAHHGLDIVSDLDRMLVFDYIIGNTDRHLNNFGIIRDASTLEWKRFAPLYDNGTSMGCDCFTEKLVSEAGSESMPFNPCIPRQMELVRDTGWIEMEAVRRGIDGASEVFGSVEQYREDGRAEAIREFLMSRADDLEAWIEKRSGNA